MNDIEKMKATLFDKARLSHSSYLECRKKFGEWDFATCSAYTRWSTAFDLIVECGLVLEYDKWLEMVTSTNS